MLPREQNQAFSSKEEEEIGKKQEVLDVILSTLACCKFKLLLSKQSDFCF